MIADSSILEKNKILFIRSIEEQEIIYEKRDEMGYCDCKQIVIENLRDAGCDETVITAFLETLKKGEIEEGLRLLGKHRDVLLDTVHKGEKQIDCLDYLVYQLNKKE